MKKFIITVLAAALFLASSVCFAKEAKNWYIVDSFDDIIGKWSVTEDDETMYINIESNKATAIDSDGDSESVDTYEEFSSSTAVILVSDDGQELRVYIDEDEKYVFTKVE